MGYKILDVKADIHEDVEKYCREHFPADYKEMIHHVENLLDIVDKNFEKMKGIYKKYSNYHSWNYND